MRDPNFRVQVSAEGLHVYNRDGLRLGQGAFELWPQLGWRTTPAHAFYMGVELAHAEIAWRLGKRYVQDQPLDWGCAVERASEDLDAWCAPGTTLHARGTSPTSGTMNDQIFETVVTTVAADGRVHVAPMGVRYRGEHVVLMPFKPSTTLDNVLATRPCGAQPGDRHARVRRLRHRPARLADAAGRAHRRPCAWPARSATSSSRWPSSTTTRSARCCAWRACTR